MNCVGVDIGGTNIKIGLVDDEGKIVQKESYKFDIEKGIDGIIEDIKDFVGIGQVDALGLAIPGSISADGRKVIHAYNLNFHDLNVVDKMEETFPKAKVKMANDADIAAYSELFGGIFEGKKSGVLLTLGTGLGGGVILDGKIFTGGNGHGTEIGHANLRYGGEQCTCGNKGCNEAYCAATWFAKAGKKVFDDNKASLIYVKADGDRDKVDAKLVIDCAKENDPDALRLFNEYVDNLSSAIASVTVMFDPEVIGVGGGVCAAGDFLMEPLRKQVNEKVFFDYEYPVLVAKNGNDAGVIGAAMLAKNG